MKRTSCFLLAAVIVLAVIAASISFFLLSDSAMDDKPGKIRIGNLPVIQGLPVYLAVEKGYFRDAGLDV